MLVDRPGAGASWTVRTLIWAAGVVGIGLIVLAVQQLLAEPAGAETPDLVDGAVGTVEQVVDPASAAGRHVRRCHGVRGAGAPSIGGDGRAGRRPSGRAPSDPATGARAGP
jgi:hypothetical protein